MKLPDYEKHCRVLIPSKEETWKDYTVFKTVTWLCEKGPSDLPNGWIKSKDSDPESNILPELVLDWFRTNINSLEIVSELTMVEFPIFASFL